ncbi:DUF4160 domain-containing protein [Dyadobacter fermentans]|uniref:DUF4160 domain-containing protein n=1 Tax=Dyadobacter fermentans TaxID=94254 RepID=UPI00286DEC8A|nr:DUF4160 domain-containing protein [Dyadobacter fermentans]
MFFDTYTHPLCQKSPAFSESSFICISKITLPPHFHAEYGGQEAQFSIETGNVIVGDLPRKQVRLIQAWVELYRVELVFNYEESQKDNGRLRKIRPLQ